jgi:hypothetical protein
MQKLDWNKYLRNQHQVCNMYKPLRYYVKDRDMGHP